MTLELKIGDVQSPKDQLVEWIVKNVDEWENWRDQNHKSRWEEYYRLWRGIWSPKDKERLRERSKAIMPALQQAIESAVAEQEEATFGRHKWFDVSDDIADPERTDMMILSDQLQEDFKFAGVPAALSECYLNGAIYGTGIGKIVISRKRLPDRKRVTVSLVPVDLDEFVIDPAAKRIDDALGMAHVTLVPRHIVLEKQVSGIYNMVDIGITENPLEQHSKEHREFTGTETVKITEYHGRVPAKMLGAVVDKPDFEDDGFVEAIITIGNDQELLKAVKNPHTHEDRDFIAYQHDTVPNEFYGRGISEKGFWPQKVLDTEVRARIDALALSTYPMMAINAAAVPRGENFEIRPGRNVFLNGEIASNIQPLQFPAPDPQTYRHTADMERFVEMATGQLQASTPVDMNQRNSTASGTSMILGASIKRSRRTLANIERQFLSPLVRKAAWRYMQYDARNYPFNDFKFKVSGTLSIMAKELEITQLNQILQTVPPGTPPYFALLKMMLERMSITEKQGVSGVIDAMLQLSLQPPEEPPDLSSQARMLSAQARAQQIQAQIAEAARKLELEEAKLQLQAREMQQKNSREFIEMSVRADQADARNVKEQADAILAIAKAEAAEVGSQLDQYKLFIESLAKTPVTSEPAQNNGEDGSTAAAKEIARLQSELEKLRSRTAKPAKSRGLQIERDAQGLITAVNGAPVIRDNNGLITGIEGA